MLQVLFSGGGRRKALRDFSDLYYAESIDNFFILSQVSVTCRSAALVSPPPPHAALIITFPRPQLHTEFLMILCLCSLRDVRDQVIDKPEILMCPVAPCHVSCADVKDDSAAISVRRGAGPAYRCGRRAARGEGVHKSSGHAGKDSNSSLAVQCVSN